MQSRRRQREHFPRRETHQLAAERLEGVELVAASIAGQAEALVQLKARG